MNLAPEHISDDTSTPYMSRAMSMHVPDAVLRCGKSTSALSNVNDLDSSANPMDSECSMSGAFLPPRDESGHPGCELVITHHAHRHEQDAPSDTPGDSVMMEYSSAEEVRFRPDALRAYKWPISEED